MTKTTYKTTANTLDKNVRALLETYKRLVSANTAINSAVETASKDDVRVQFKLAETDADLKNATDMAEAKALKNTYKELLEELELSNSINKAKAEEAKVALTVVIDEAIRDYKTALASLKEADVIGAKEMSLNNAVEIRGKITTRDNEIDNVRRGIVNIIKAQEIVEHTRDVYVLASGEQFRLAMPTSYLKSRDMAVELGHVGRRLGIKS